MARTEQQATLDTLRHATSRHFFHSYLVRCSRHVDLDLWQAIEAFRSIPAKDTSTLREQAQLLVDTYLTDEAALRSLALPAQSLLQIDRVRALILVSSVAPNMFDDLQAFCLSRMAKDMPKFLAFAMFAPSMCHWR
jgi:hypothetical protein